LSKALLLGSGTSTGVPTIACTCPTCLSDDPRDKRLRPSLLYQSDTTTIVFDTSSDFRTQMLRYGVTALDAIVFTHHHFDHIGGFDDIRPYNFFSGGKPLPLYLMKETLTALQTTFPYAFGKVEQLGGGVPIVETHTITENSFLVQDIEILPIPMYHGSMRVNGYRIGNFAYCTDTNYIPDTSLELLMDLDVLVLDALRYEPHPTHFTIDQAIEIVKKLQPRKTYFTHIAHQVKHAECQLPDGIELGYDGLEITL